MDKINEVIVVEGANDTKKLQTYFNVDTIETNGTHLSKQKIELIKAVKEKRGIIIFTDPDAPGEKIRARINEQVKGCKQAFVFKEEARTTKKVGIEHASKETLEKALNNLVSYFDSVESITLSEFNRLGLNGQSDSASKRMKIAKEYNLGKCNAKTLFKRINMLRLTKKDIESHI